MRALNRLECVGETLRAALNALAVVAPAWLHALAEVAWVDRYGPRVDDYRLPQGQEERQAYGETIGRDGLRVLASAYAPDAPTWLREVPAVQTLRRVWLQHFYLVDGLLRWRTAEVGTPPSSLMINSPYDLDAHYAKKRTTSWIGYKVHITETCEDDTPHLITHVETDDRRAQAGESAGQARTGSAQGQRARSWEGAARAVAPSQAADPVAGRRP